MSSSGVIYAIIVGAWAVYLVPMWLRREDELNRARETQRYAAAIKVLANKEAFERRWARPTEAGSEAEEALPIAAGQSFVPTRAVKRTTATAKPSTAQPRKAKAATDSVVPSRKPVKRPIAVAAAAATTAAVAATTARNVVTATIAANDTEAARAQTAPRRTSAADAAIATGGGAGTAPKSPVTAPGPRPLLRPRTGLMARRRRVVALLFAISTLGALVSADLGARYLWAMAIPAVLLSAYIARLRRDERIRVATRAAKRAAAQAQAQAARAAEAAREADLAHAEAEQAHATQAEATHADVRAEADQRRRTEAARRRASAAARARAQAFATEAPDLRQASNG